MEREGNHKSTKLFEYILLETDVDHLITGRGHTDDFQDLSVLLLQRCDLSTSGNLGLKKEPHGHKRVQNYPARRAGFVHFRTFLLPKSPGGQ